LLGGQWQGAYGDGRNGYKSFQFVHRLLSFGWLTDKSSLWQRHLSSGRFITGQSYQVGEPGYFIAASI